MKRSRARGTARARGAGACVLPNSPGTIALLADGVVKRLADGAVFRLEPSDDAGQFRARVDASTVMDRYLNRGEVTQRQYDSSQKFYRAFYRAGLEPHVTAIYGEWVRGTAGAGENLDVHSHIEFQRALRAVGIILSPVLVHVVCIGGSAMDWAVSTMRHPKSGIEILRLALDSLANHYGLPAEKTGG